LDTSETRASGGIVRFGDLTVPEGCSVTISSGRTYERATPSYSVTVNASDHTALQRALAATVQRLAAAGRLDLDRRPPDDGSAGVPARA
jgi:hypothetical protein